MMNKIKLAGAAGVAVSLGLGMSVPAFAATQGSVLKLAQAQPTEIETVIATYRQAQADLETAKSGGGDVPAAERNLKKATTELGRLCKILGQTDLEQCILAVTGTPAAAPTADQPAESNGQAETPAGPVEPPPQLQVAVGDYEKSNKALADEIGMGGDVRRAEAETKRAQEAVDRICQQLGQSDTAACLAQFGLELTPMAVAPASADQPQPASESQPPAKTEPQPADQPAGAVVQSDTAKDQTVVDNPSGQPMSRQLGRAVAKYEQANTRLANAVVGTREANAARRDLDTAVADIEKICMQEGQPDMQACLAGFGVVLSPVAVPMQETAKPEKPVAIPPQDAAPVLDSAKDALKEGAPPPAVPPKAEQPPPESDAAAQAGAVPKTIPSIEDVTGTKVAAPPKRDQPPAAKVVEQTGLRIVFQFNNQLIITNQSDSRLTFGATERYVEELPLGRTRETVVRADGTRLVTVYNRNGDILRRSRFDRDGNETVLSYVPDNYDQDLLNWRDPGMDLPPLQLNIPQQDYVLDADRANLDDLTRFLDEPPVENVQRLYSIDEVKRSARLRDMVRRLEIGNLTFEFGSASIPPDQIGALSIVANAMLDLIDKNPAETFLIEGHTDAVGTDLANLILSDRRAETVAIALTQVFGVPPENLATQGYGERYLKVDTQTAERLNRRVTIRRITPLVAPETSSFTMN